jgi:hypothetical protein
MSFLNKLKDIFTYSGETEEDNSINKSEELDSIDLREDNFRLNLDNPLKYIKNVVNNNKQKIKNNIIEKQNNVSRNTLNKLYTFIHLRIEYKLNKGKPVEEGILLYKRFLEDKVIDEGMYSDTDLLYVKELINIMKSLYENENKEYINIEDIVDELCSNKYIFNILEILEIQQKFMFLDYFINKSYIVCGYSYISESNNNINDIIKSLNKGVFKLELDNIIFIIVNELSSVISNDNELNVKIDYISSKLKTFLKQYLLDNKNIIPLFLKYNNLFDDNNIKENSNVNLEINNSIETLRNKFINLYKPLTDLENEDISITDLKSAIEDINNNISLEDYTMSQEEYKILKSLEERYDLMKER